MENINPLIFSVIGFVLTLLYQYLEDKRIKINRQTYWDKIKFPLLICLIIYFILSFYCTETNNYSEEMFHEIYTDLPNF